MQKTSAILLLFLLTISIMVISCKSEQKDNQNTTGSAETSSNLQQANELTSTVFHYVEMVETKQMTQAEADEKSAVVKQELAQLRSQMTPDELKQNDSIRQVLGHQMIDRVMKWRKDNGLIQEENQQQ